MSRRTGAYERERQRRKAFSAAPVFGAIAVFLVICLIAGVYYANRPQPALSGGETGTTAGTAQTDPSSAATAEPTQPPTEPEPTLPYPQQAIQTFCQQHGLTEEDYPESIVAMMIRNPETEEFALNYPLEHGKEHTADISGTSTETVPLFLQWDPRWGYIDYGDDVAGLTACGPVSLSMVAYYLTGDPDMSPDQIIQFALDYGYCCPGNGSYWSLMDQGAAQLGLSATQIGVDRDQIMEYLDMGQPIICAMGPGDFTVSGHFIVLAGSENGLVRVNDCNSRARSERLWDINAIIDQIDGVWVYSLY